MWRERNHNLRIPRFETPTLGQTSLFFKKMKSSFLLCQLLLTLLFPFLMESNLIIQLQSIHSEYTIRSHTDQVQIQETYKFVYSTSESTEHTILNTLYIPIFKKSVFCFDPQITLVEVWDGSDKLSGTIVPSLQTDSIKYIKIDQALNITEKAQQSITMKYFSTCVVDPSGSKITYYKHSKGFIELQDFSTNFNATVRLLFLDLNFTKNQLLPDPNYVSIVLDNEVWYSQITPHKTVEGDKEILLSTAFPSIFPHEQHFIGNLIIVIILAVVCTVAAIAIVGGIVGFYFYRRKKLEANPRLQEEDSYENL